MTRIIKQCMVSGSTIGDLSDNLDKMLIDGWQPFGTLFVATMPSNNPGIDSMFDTGDSHFVQQMVKRES